MLLLAIKMIYREADNSVVKMLIIGMRKHAYLNSISRYLMR